MKTILNSFRFRAQAIALGVFCWYIVELTALFNTFPLARPWVS